VKGLLKKSLSTGNAGVQKTEKNKKQKMEKETKFA
jgi:hypothetical protein